MVWHSMSVCHLYKPSAQAISSTRLHQVVHHMGHTSQLLLQGIGLDTIQRKCGAIQQTQCTLLMFYQSFTGGTEMRQQPANGSRKLEMPTKSCLPSAESAHVEMDLRPP